MTAALATDRLVGRLCEVSRRAHARSTAPLDWPETLGGDEWCFAPELLSLHGTDLYAGLGETERKRLSFFEAVSFFSLNIHGEKALVEGIARRLYRRDSLDVTPYLHHFLDEENRHMEYFAEFCTRYAGKIYPDRKIAFPRDYAEGEEDCLFFVKVLVFEEIVDVLNARMARDRRLAPVVREINRRHHRDETRHLAFGRSLVRRLFERHAPKWSGETLDGVRGYVEAYVRATWKEYYNPDAYRDAGFAEPHRVQREAFDHAASRERRREVSSGLVGLLLGAGILEKEPEP